MNTTYGLWSKRLAICLFSTSLFFSCLIGSEKVTKTELEKDAVNFVVLFCETSDNGALTDKLRSAIIQEIPVITSYRLVRYYLNPNSPLKPKSSDTQVAWKNILDTTKWDIYKNKKGDFFVLIPAKYKENPNRFGLNFGILSQVSREELEKPILKSIDLPATQLSIDNFEQLFDYGIKSYKRIHLTGHGCPDIVADITVNQMAKLIFILNRLNTQFLAILSCYAGGLNIIELQKNLSKSLQKYINNPIDEKGRDLPKIDIRYPIVILSTTDAVTYSSGGSFRDFFDKLNMYLLKNPYYGRSLIQSKLAKPTRITIQEVIEPLIINLSEVHQPSSLPSIRFTGAQSTFKAIPLKNIMSITDALLKKLKYGSAISTMLERRTLDKHLMETKELLKEITQFKEQLESDKKMLNEKKLEILEKILDSWAKSPEYEKDKPEVVKTFNEIVEDINKPLQKLATEKKALEEAKKRVDRDTLTLKDKISKEQIKASDAISERKRIRDRKEKHNKWETDIEIREKKILEDLETKKLVALEKYPWTKLPAYSEQKSKVAQQIIKLLNTVQNSLAQREKTFMDEKKLKEISLSEALSNLSRTHQELERKKLEYPFEDLTKKYESVEAELRGVEEKLRQIDKQKRVAIKNSEKAIEDMQRKKTTVYWAHITKQINAKLEQIKKSLELKESQLKQESSFLTDKKKEIALNLEAAKKDLEAFQGKEVSEKKVAIAPTIDIPARINYVLVYPNDLRGFKFSLPKPPSADMPMFISKIPGNSNHFLGEIIAPHYDFDNLSATFWQDRSERNKAWFIDQWTANQDSQENKKYEIVVGDKLQSLIFYHMTIAETLLHKKARIHIALWRKFSATENKDKYYVYGIKYILYPDPDLIGSIHKNPLFKEVSGKFFVELVDSIYAATEPDKEVLASGLVSPFEDIEAVKKTYQEFRNSIGIKTDIKPQTKEAAVKFLKSVFD